MPNLTFIDSKFWRPAPALLLVTALLTACGGGNSSGGSGGGNNPNPPASTAKSNISGTLYLPGASGRAATPAQVQGGPADGAGEVIPGRYLVRLRPGLSAQSLGEPSLSALSVGGTVLKPELMAPALGLAVYSSRAPLSQQQSGEVLQQLSALPQLEAVEPDRVYHAFATPNDPYFKYEWGAQAMGLPAAWDRTTGKNVTVAVVDSGIIAHPDLQGQVLPGMDFVSDAATAGDGNGLDTDPTDTDLEGDFHGSHVAGIIAARANNGEGIAGVNWGARIVPVRVLGLGGEGSMADILLGTYWAAGGKLTYPDGSAFPANPNPAKVINLSLGGDGACSALEQDTFDELARAGVVTVVAAGNEATDVRNSSPGNCQNVITVGATGPDGARAPYSNYGSRIDLVAPGGNSNLTLTVEGRSVPGGILSTVYNPETKDYDYSFLSGTSMAAPQVAGAVSLLLGEEPGLSFGQVRDRLRASAAPLSGACSGGCGAGLLNVPALLRQTASPTPTPPPTITTAPIYVAALYQLAQGFDESRSQITQVTSQRLNVAYSLSGLTPGRYQVAAWQDLNGNQEIDDDEPFGMYASTLNPQSVVADSVARTISGISFDLETYGLIGQSLAPGKVNKPELKAAIGRLVHQGGKSL